MAWEYARNALNQRLGGEAHLRSSDFVPDQASLQHTLAQYLLQEFRSVQDEADATEGLSDADKDAVDITRLLSLLQSDCNGTLRRLLEGRATGGEPNGIDAEATQSPTAEELRSTRSAKATRSSYFGQDGGLPVLNIAALGLGLEKGLVQELAYQLFLSSCGRQCTPDNLQDMRRHLQISQTRGQELQRVAAAADSLVSRSTLDRLPSTELAAANNLASLSTQASLLQRLRPTDFQSYAAFAAWRSDITQLLLSVLNLAAREMSRRNTRLASSCHISMARLKGALRRADIPTAEEFEESEYKEATNAVHKAVSGLASQSTSGWAFPWGLRVQLAEIVLMGVFDSQDGGYIAQHDVMLQGIRHNLWPLLGISAAVADGLWAWVHFCEFASKRSWGSLASAREAVQQLAESQSQLGSPELWDSPAPVEEAHFSSEVASAITEWIRMELSDYHTNFHDNTAIMQGLVEILALSLQVKAPPEKGTTAPASTSVQQVLGDCLRRSVAAAYDRLLAAAAEESDNKSEVLAQVASEAGALLRAEREVFSPALQDYLPEPGRAAAATLYTLFGQQLKPYLAQAVTLEDSVVVVVRAAQRLEAQFGVSVEPKQSQRRPSVLVKGAATSESNPWGPRPAPPAWELDRAVSRLSETWADAKLAQVHSWMVRLCEKEDWKAVHQERGCAKIAVEINLFLENVIEALIDMQIRVPVATVEHITAGIDDAMQRLVAYVLQGVGNADLLVPPVPPMTRFKRQVAVKAAQADVDLARAPSMTPNVPGMVGNQDMDRQAARVASISTESTVVRLNSFVRLIEALDLQERRLREWWQQIHVDATQMPAEVGDTPGDKLHFHWVRNMFEGASAQLHEGLESLCTFLGIKVIFWELRAEVLEELYKHSVERSRLQPILNSIDDDHLGNLVELAVPGLQPLLARGILSALAAGLRRVYLDGGPARLFTPGDVPLLTEDLAAAKAMFYAGGEGLPSEQIDKLCKDLDQILYVMQMDVNSLIKRLEAAQGSGQQGSGEASKSLANDSEVLIRVLSHRADHEASKYLKKWYKLPKGLEENMFARVKGKLQLAPRPSAPRAL